MNANDATEGFDVSQRANRRDGHFVGSRPDDILLVPAQRIVQPGDVVLAEIIVLIEHRKLRAPGVCFSITGFFSAKVPNAT